jgi:hypothetical protein
MNDLRSLYQRHYAQMLALRERFGGVNMDGPTLSTPTTYFDQPVRLIVIDNEAHVHTHSHRDVDVLLSLYRSFDMGDAWHSSLHPFWNLVRKIEVLLGISRCSCAWTNLERYQMHGRCFNQAAFEAIKSLDFLVREEIKILRPDVCLFFTHRKRDARLRAIYNSLDVQNIPGLPAPHFSRLHHPDLPAFTLRAPYPRHIKERGLEDSFLKILCQQLHQHSASLNLVPVKDPPRSASLLGQRLVCVDDTFDPNHLAAAYTTAPVKGRTYTLNEIHISVRDDRTHGTLIHAGNFLELAPRRFGVGIPLHCFRFPDGGTIEGTAALSRATLPCSLQLCSLPSYDPPGAEKFHVANSWHPLLHTLVRIHRPNLEPSA